MKWTERAVMHEALIASRAALVPLPDTKVIERRGWFQLITPSLKQGGLNEVAGAVVSAFEVDQVIERTRATYRELGIRFRWQVDPASRPFDLGERLARAGMASSPSRVMWRTTGLPTPSERTSEVQIERVTERTLDVFSEVLAQGWNMAPGALATLNRLMLESGAHSLWLGFVDGVPAGAASVALLPRSAYLSGGVVLPAYRSRGVYRALVMARLRVAAAAELSIVTSLAREATSAPILEQLGFVGAGAVQMFEGP